MQYGAQDWVPATGISDSDCRFTTDRPDFTSVFTNDGELNNTFATCDYRMDLSRPDPVEGYDWRFATVRVCLLGGYGGGAPHTAHLLSLYHSKTTFEGDPFVATISYDEFPLSVYNFLLIPGALYGFGTDPLALTDDSLHCGTYREAGNALDTTLGRAYEDWDWDDQADVENYYLHIGFGENEESAENSGTQLYGVNVTWVPVPQTAS